MPPRFPPIRRVLWDRTPSGPPQRVPLLAFAPKICLGAAAHELARQAKEAKSRPKALRLVLRSSEGSEPTWLAERLGDRSGQDEVALDLGALPECRATETLGISTKGPDAGGEVRSSPSRCRLAPSMAQTLHRQLEALPEGPEEMAASASSSTEKFWRWAGAVSMDRLQRCTQLRLAAKYPKWAFHATALARPLRTLDTPLLQELSAPSSRSLGFGFLTLDQGRRVLCLMENEQLTQQVPLVGVWVDLRAEEVTNLPTLAAHPAVWAAAAHFVHRRNVKEKVWVETSAFLVMAALRQRSRPPEAGLLFAELRFEEEPGEGLYVASMDYDQASASIVDKELETFAADYTELLKIAEQLPHEKVIIKDQTLVPSPKKDLASSPTGHGSHFATKLTSPKQKRIGADSIGSFRPEEPRAEAPQPVEEECSHCGAGYVPTARFCSRCGQRRPITSASPASAASPVPMAETLKMVPAVPWGVPGESSPPSSLSRRSDGSREEIPLWHIVGQQQQQLGVLQQQLQTVQDLLVQLVARDPRDPPPVAVGTAVPQPIAPVPVIPAAPVPVTPVTPAPVGTPSDAVTMVPKAEIRPAIKADAAVGDSEVSVANAATSPMQQNRTVSTGLQVAPVLQDAAVGDSEIASKPLELPKLRDSADTAGGASPRAADPPLPVTSWTVPRIICPADWSPRSEDGDLSDGSLELLASDYPLDAHRLGLF